MRLKILISILIIALMVSSVPVSASSDDADPFFLCEKTNQAGDSIHPDSPQYDRVDYDNGLVYILNFIFTYLLIGVFAFGILGGIYATLRDAFYTPENDDDGAYYVKMRIKLIIAGILIPIFILIGAFIVEFITEYETTCMLPSLF